MAGQEVCLPCEVHEVGQYCVTPHEGLQHLSQRTTTPIAYLRRLIFPGSFRVAGQVSWLHPG
jgi:hypothetical protein